MTQSAVLLLLAFSCAASHAQAAPRYTLLNINNLTHWLRSDGQSSHSPKANNGTRFPRGTTSVVYQDGILWGAKAYLDSAKTISFNQLIRVGGATYSVGTREGRVLGFGAEARPADPLSAESRIYRIRRDYFSMTNEELRRDAAEVFEIKLEQVTTEQMQTVAAQYERDWKEWPAAFGAPFVDRNHDGVYTPPPQFSTSFTGDDLIAGNYDEPGIRGVATEEPADQVIWTVYNDLDAAQSQKLYGSLPLGLEVQVTLWAYQTDAPWAGYYFRRMRFINKGGVALDEQNQRGAFWIDSMYVGQWSDADLGYAGDDLVGCDTLRQLGYIYNASVSDPEFRKFNLAAPSVGYCLVQGPRVRAKNDSAWFDFKRISGWRNLPMLAFTYFTPGGLFDPPPLYYQGLRYYKALKGFAPKDGVHDYYPFPPGFTPNHFPLSGDPIRSVGHIDGLGYQYSFPPGDRRFMISTGPFHLSPGDTQEVVFAFVAGLGVDWSSSVKNLKHVAQVVGAWYPHRPRFFHPPEENAAETLPPSDYSLSPSFPNPFSSRTSFDYTLKRDAHVRLSIFDLLGREVAVVEDRAKLAGTHHASWNGRDQQGRALPSGVYFYRLHAGHIKLVRKAVLVH